LWKQKIIWRNEWTEMFGAGEGAGRWRLGHKLHFGLWVWFGSSYVICHDCNFDDKECLALFFSEEKGLIDLLSWFLDHNNPGTNVLSLVLL
jgi:hypothetical protein